MIDSVRAQTYAQWELVIVNASPDDEGVCEVLADYNDERIHVVACPENRGIAGKTNMGIARSAGEYVCFLDHDDVVESQALAIMVRAAIGGSADLVYCDEDSIDSLRRFRIPLFKPRRNIDLLYSNDYVLHWLMVSRDVLNRTARSGPEVDGAQDYDLTLKAFEGRCTSVRVPYVLYHWRIHEGSMNNNPESKQYAQESGRIAIASHLERRHLVARVGREVVPSTYRVDFAEDGRRQSMVCVAVGGLSSHMVEKLRNAGCESGSLSVVELSETASVDDIRALLEDRDEDLALFVSRGLLIDAASIETMVGYFSRSEVFAVSPRVLLSNGLVDQAGCIVAPDGSLISLGKCLPAGDEGYIGRLHRPYDASVLDADCCIVRISSLLDVGIDGRFETWGHAFADACLSAYERGMANVYTPFARATWEMPRSFLMPGPRCSAHDRALLKSRHRRLLALGDPSHNPNFDPWSPHYRLNPEAGLPWESFKDVYEAETEGCL